MVEGRPLLWSGRATVYLGFFFSPAFASALEAWNWYRLGNRWEVKKSIFYGVGYELVSISTYWIPSPKEEHRLALDFTIAVTLFLAWYFVRGCFHARMLFEATNGLFRARSAWLGIGLGIAFFLCLSLVDWSISKT